MRIAGFCSFRLVLFTIMRISYFCQSGQIKCLYDRKVNNFVIHLTIIDLPK